MGLSSRQPLGTRFSTSLRQGARFWELNYSPDERVQAFQTIEQGVADGILSEQEAAIVTIEVIANTWPVVT